MRNTRPPLIASITVPIDPNLLHRIEVFQRQITRDRGVYVSRAWVVRQLVEAGLEAGLP